MACLRSWRTSVGGEVGMPAWMAWVVCLSEWCASVLEWVVWVACLRG